MNRFHIWNTLFIIPLLAACSNGMVVEVSNPVDLDRQAEIVEIDMDDVVEGLSLSEGETFIIKDHLNKELPYQITNDDKLIFPVCIPAGKTLDFAICKGVPSAYQTKACGNHYPGRDDDIAWENDIVGFRMYGHKDDVASGYDVFVKRGTDLPVLPSFYAAEVSSSDAWKRYYELLENDEKAAFRFKMDSLSYHVDHGYGMDCYGVGPTLGAGVAALKDKGGNIIYPFCFDTFEILDNGPLRFALKLTYRPFSIDSDRDVVETRIITLDVGSHLNRTEVSYQNLTERKDIVAGIVLQDNKGNEISDAENGYIAYPAPSINVDSTQVVDNGTIFVGHAYPDMVKEAGTFYFSTEESSMRNGTKGHVLSISEYCPGESFIYYWGAAWDHFDMKSYDEWKDYLSDFSVQIRNPLKVTIR